MIASVQGKLIHQAEDHIVIQVGGVGLRLEVPRSVFDEIDSTGQTMFLHTYLVVREDALTLFGFVTETERDLFITLISVSGIGPRIALAILSTLSLNQLSQAVAQEEPGLLTRVPGIGKKTAQKILFELKDKLDLSTAATGLVTISDIDADVLDTLTALGYSIVEAQAALQAIPRDAPQEIETRVRLALGYFST